MASSVLFQPAGTAGIADAAGSLNILQTAQSPQTLRQIHKTSRRTRGFQAVILAGGLGTRLWPLTKTVPKAMAPVAGRPFLEYQLDYLRRGGVSEVVICLGYLGHLIQEHFGDGRRFGVRIRYGYEQDRLLGTAGAVKNVEGYLREVFFVIYGDSYAVVDFRQVMEFFLRHDRLGLMVVLRNENRWDRSNVIIDGSFVRVYSKGELLRGMVYIDFGVSLFRREAFAHLRPGEAADLSTVYHHLIAQEQFLAYEARQRFYEIGSPEGLAEFEALVHSGAIPVPGGVATHPGSLRGANHPSVRVQR
ncbi:MAG: nucleotidyltransferase family protein [Armatimonadota bacterium]|nr:nucleotidyltransferase family protein [Armatimonadota bacterium]MDR7471003.1 nucleotidyltransferase family protein [Armatimonadota bacterium]